MDEDTVEGAGILPLRDGWKDFAEPSGMEWGKYRSVRPLVLDDRTWPGRSILAAPRWCSVDLRDGNQALIDPMDPERKMSLFKMLVTMGFKEIEVGFPSASSTDYDFVRKLIDGDLIPDDVTIQVLVQCREELIRKTFKCLVGSKRAIVHFYNSTSPTQRRVVFGLERAGIIDIATRAAALCKQMGQELRGTDVYYEYSPESFTATEPEFAVSICEAVMEVIEPSVQRPLILNLPATVETYGPNVYADVVEWFGRSIKDRDRVVISLHPHNDRGCAVAAGELGLLAGAQRIEGTLFGNGERTGNVDLVTMAMNLFVQGIDPCLDMSDLAKIRRVAEDSTRMEVHPRHPYVGDFVYTAFSGSHQDAIKKGLDSIGTNYRLWDVPYLPVDPAHTGRSYDSIIRVNSQSGKGGIAYIMHTEFNLDLPRRLQIEFSAEVQYLAEQTGAEIPPEALWKVFNTTYLSKLPIELLTYEVSTGITANPGSSRVTAQLLYRGQHQTVAGVGNGPIAALVGGLEVLVGSEFEVLDFSEHALSRGSDATAVAFVEVRGDGAIHWGVGLDSSVLDASLKAVVSAVNNLIR